MNIKIILLKPVANLGKKGDVVAVTKGYARNYLFPAQLAKITTPGEEVQLAKEKAAVLRRSAEHLEELKKIHQSLSNKRVSIAKKASGKGKLYAAVTPADIVPTIYDTYGFHLPEEVIKIPTSIKTLGLHVFKIILTGEGELSMKVKVVAL